MKIELFIDKSLEENAQEYYERAKKAKKKLTGAKQALEETRKKANLELKKKEASALKSKLVTLEKSRKKEWYEKFRWFLSSDNFLVIGGRDASTNEIVVKKHMDQDDLVYHTDAPGSPFVIIKNPDKKEIPKETKEEAACFAATFSKAWDLGIKRVEVFEVDPEQVSKQAKSGEYISKGAFMVQGKRTHYTPVLSLAVGYFNEPSSPGLKVIMSGPESAVKKKCEKSISLTQGDLKKGDVAKLLMKKFDLASNESILSCLPSGKFSVKK
ncbi:hypothetical protein COV13_02980 [Candidatus Woesearchaeota archaeon CG10_big_fil_rev_8_21_14_0_10_32_9]|nr:MAG: hypothetical protein COV13_02980 [Candidatus Woesearchaeota archaeon CG10_big_fil_rev_8_21_14_0_10_32_9]